MKFASNATNLHRKFGVAYWGHLLLSPCPMRYLETPGLFSLTA
jgi:hypothetical protein